MSREEIMQLNTDYLNGCESEHKMNELFSYALSQEPIEDDGVDHEKIRKAFAKESDIKKADIADMIPKVIMQAEEETNRFIFNTIRPYCEEITQQEISNTQKSGKWIPISERLPEDSGEYLIAIKDRHYNEQWDKDYPTGNYTLRSIQPPKHFNCKHCGAANQVDICEYCGSAYEEGESE